VKTSAKTEYACIAMLELASQYALDEPVRIRSIADRHGIPSRFLVQILLQLKGAGLVASTRGAAGGYQLSKPPDEITMGEVISVFEGPPESGAAAGFDSPAARIVAQTWREITEIEQQMLNSLTFAELIERARHQHEPMYYI
jgi:Rrf2 family protein